jgi:hypothetical protein
MAPQHGNVQSAMKVFNLSAYLVAKLGIASGQWLPQASKGCAFRIQAKGRAPLKPSKISLLSGWSDVNKKIWLLHCYKFMKITFTIAADFENVT